MVVLEVLHLFQDQELLQCLKMVELLVLLITVMVDLEDLVEAEQEAVLEEAMVVMVVVAEDIPVPDKELPPKNLAKIAERFMLELVAAAALMLELVDLEDLVEAEQEAVLLIVVQHMQELQELPILEAVAEAAAQVQQQVRPVLLEALVL